MEDFVVPASSLSGYAAGTAAFTVIQQLRF